MKGVLLGAISKGRATVVGSTILLAVSLLLPGAAASDPPPNDSFANAVEVTLPFESVVDISSASAEAVDAGLCPSNRTVWYAVDLAEDQWVTVETVGTSFNTDIAMFSDGAVPLLPTCTTTYSRTFTASSAGRYLIRVGTKDLNPQGLLSLTIYEPGTISGRVVDGNGDPIPNVWVEIYHEGEDYSFMWWYYTDSDGKYSIPGLDRGRYELFFYDGDARFINSWYHDSLERSGDTTIEVVNGPVTLQDQTMQLGGSIIGSITLPDGSPVSACLELYNADEGWANWGLTNEDGSFRLMPIATGSYKLAVRECGWAPYGVFEDEWYQDATSFEAAAPISVTVGQETTGIDVVVTPQATPSNDNIENAIAVDEMPASFSRGLTMATTEGSDPLDCGIVGRTVWYSYTPTEDELLFLNGYAVNATMAVHVIEADGSMSLVGCAPPDYGNSTRLEVESGKKYMFEAGSRSLDGPSGVRYNLFDSEGGGTVQFSPPNPCLVQCPYWNQTSTTEQKNEDACATNPASNEGSWQDFRVDVPASINGKIPYRLGFTMDPTVDHDVWFCRVEPDADGKYLVTYSANTPTQRCDNGLPLGCPEGFEASVAPGKSYIIRVYNWSDPSPVDGTYWFMANKPVGATPAQR